MIKVILSLLFILPFVAFAQSCPTGMIAVEYDNYVASTGGVCSAGFVAHDVADVCSGASTGACWLIEQMRALCGAGISVLKTSNGVSVPLYAEKYTSPALHVRYNGQVCYANLTQGKSENAINIRYGGAVYHVAE